MIQELERHFRDDSIIVIQMINSIDVNLYQLGFIAIVVAVLAAIWLIYKLGKAIARFIKRVTGIKDDIRDL